MYHIPILLKSYNIYLNVNIGNFLISKYFDPKPLYSVSREDLQS